MARHSVSFYICAAFLAIFGFVGLSSVDPGSAKVELGLAVLVLAAGLYLHSGAEQGRLVGMVALGVVIAYGVWQLTQGQYVPGTIVAGLAMIRLASAGSPHRRHPSGTRRGTTPATRSSPTVSRTRTRQPASRSRCTTASSRSGRRRRTVPRPPPPAPRRRGTPLPRRPTVGDPRFGPPAPAVPQPYPAPTQPATVQPQPYDPYAPPPGR